MKYLFVLFVTAFFFALTYASAPAEFNDYELIAIASLIVFVTGIEFLAALIFHRSKLLQNLLLSAFLVGNIVFVNLILNAAFTGLTRVYQLIAVLVAGFILSVFMKMIDENRHLAKAIPAIAFLMIVGVLTESAFSTAPAIDLESEKDLAKSKAQNIRMVEFNKKPNVYFVSFDSMIPKVLLRKYMEVESTAYHEVLDANFRRFKNFFADRYPTDSSLNSLLALDIEYFSDATRDGTEMLFYPGMAPSPLFEIFKHNGYETTSLFASKYFGAKKGPYVDFYRTSPKSLALKHGPCAFIKLNGIRAFTYLGYCTLIQSKILQSIFARLGVKELFGDTRKGGLKFLVEHMKASKQKNVPQFYLAYIYLPGHTIDPFDRNNKKDIDAYRKKYLAKSKEAASYIDSIIEFVDKEDPTAIVYLFGDHGPKLSRGVTFEDDPKFFVQDRFGVYGGNYSRDRCRESFSRPLYENYMTIAQGAHMIIGCLSGGEFAFKKLPEYRLPNPIWTNKTPEIESKEGARYEDFLYE